MSLEEELKQLERKQDDVIDHPEKHPHPSMEYHVGKREAYSEIREMLRVHTEKIRKKIENSKVDLLGMFCYQGPPTKHWIETKGQFWKGWNVCCDKLIDQVLAELEVGDKK